VTDRQTDGRTHRQNGLRQTARLTTRNKTENAQPEDGNKQIDEQDGCYQNVDKEHCHRDPGNFRTAWNIGIVHVDSSCVVAVVDFTYKEQNMHIILLHIT